MRSSVTMKLALGREDVQPLIHCLRLGGSGLRTTGCEALKDRADLRKRVGGVPSRKAYE